MTNVCLECKYCEKRGLSSVRYFYFACTRDSVLETNLVTGEKKRQPFYCCYYERLDDSGPHRELGHPRCGKAGQFFKPK